MQIYARTSMVKVQDAPSVAHEMCSSVYRALKQGAYLCFCRVSTAQDVPNDPLVHSCICVDLRAETRQGLMQAQPVCRACMLAAACFEGIQALVA